MVELTGVSPKEARELLEAYGSVEAAAAAYFDEAMEEEGEGPPPLEEAPDWGAAAAPAPLAPVASTKPKAKAAPKGNVRSLADLGGDDDDSEDEGRETYIGGAKRHARGHQRRDCAVRHCAPSPPSPSAFGLLADAAG